jgi:hypothetical protein
LQRDFKADGPVLGPNRNQHPETRQGLEASGDGGPLSNFSMYKPVKPVRPY